MTESFVELRHACFLKLIRRDTVNIGVALQLGDPGPHRFQGGLCLPILRHCFRIATVGHGCSMARALGCYSTDVRDDAAASRRVETDASHKPSPRRARGVSAAAANVAI